MTVVWYYSVISYLFVNVPWCCFSIHTIVLLLVGFQTNRSFDLTVIMMTNGSCSFQNEVALKRLTGHFLLRWYFFVDSLLALNIFPEYIVVCFLLLKLWIVVRGALYGTMCADFFERYFWKGWCSNYLLAKHMKPDMDIVHSPFHLKLEL